MGTKQNPGAFDCYANANVDEPMFIILGRDRHGAITVFHWLALRLTEASFGGKQWDADDVREMSQREYMKLPEKYREAWDCANSMETYHDEVMKGTRVDPRRSPFKG